MSDARRRTLARLQQLLVIATATSAGGACADLAGEHHAHNAPPPQHPNEPYENHPFQASDPIAPPPDYTNEPMHGSDPVPPPQLVAPILASAAWSNYSWSPTIDVRLHASPAGPMKVHVVSATVDVLQRRVEGDALVITLAAPASPGGVGLTVEIDKGGPIQTVLITIQAVSAPSPNTGIGVSVTQL